MKKMLPALLLALACSSQKPVPASAPTVRRSILSNGQRVGFSVVTWNPDGTITNTVDIHDNGRGPHADAVIRLAPDGTIASLDATGHTELNAPVDEHFALRNGRASWNSREEHGEKDLTGPAYFIPNSATDSDAFLIAALRKNGGTLQLLPGGTARVENVGEATLPLAGRQMHLIAQAITGVSFTPNYVWTRDDGSFFAEVAPGFWFGEEGAESAADALTARQEEIRRARDKSIADRLGHKPPAAGFALTHARVLDIEKGRGSPIRRS